MTPKKPVATELGLPAKIHLFAALGLKKIKEELPFNTKLFLYRGDQETVKRLLLEAITETGDIRNISPTGHFQVNMKRRFNGIDLATENVVFVRTTGPLSLVTTIDKDAAELSSQRRNSRTTIVAVLNTTIMDELFGTKP